MMYLNKKISCFLLFLIFFSSNIVFSQTAGNRFQITSVKYELEGQTRVSALKEMLKIDQETVFKNQKEFDDYLAWLRAEFDGFRVFSYTEVQVFYGVRNAQTGITPVELLMKAKDGHGNKIVVPFPKYTSANGLKITFKARNYNFMGTMQMFDLNFGYNYYTAEKPVIKHIISADTGFTVPIKAFGHDINWNNNIEVSKVFVDKDKEASKAFKPAVSYSTSLGIWSQIDKKSSIYVSPSASINYTAEGNLYYNIGQSTSYSRRLTDIASLNLNFSEYFYRNPGYIDDIYYLNNSIGASLPITLGRIPNFNSVTWTPSVSFGWNWDADALKQNPAAANKSDMIDHSDLKGPVITFSHSIGSGKLERVGNYRKGFLFSLGQSWGYNLYTKTIPMPTFTLNTQMYLPSERIALYNRTYWYYNMGGGTSVFGGRMRGIRDNDAFASDNAIVFNFDVPMRLIQTDWAGWGFPAWMRKIDFEVLVSPFVDVALGHNIYTNTNFLIADGYYSGGIEILGYPTHMRSVIGRISVGLDLARTVLPGRVVNKSWRPDVSKYEMFFGLGVFY